VILVRTAAFVAVLLASVGVGTLDVKKSDLVASSRLNGRIASIDPRWFHLKWQVEGKTILDVVFTTSVDGNRLIEVGPWGPPATWPFELPRRPARD
jgi:hypothetical protein